MQTAQLKSFNMCVACTCYMVCNHTTQLTFISFQLWVCSMGSEKMEETHTMEVDSIQLHMTLHK